MSTKKKQIKPSVRELMNQGKAKRNKRFDKLTGEKVPKGQKLEPMLWEELVKVNNGILSHMNKVVMELTNMVNNPTVQERIVGHPDEKLFNGAFNTFNTDALIFINDLEKIMKSHEDKTGEVTTQEELEEFQNYYLHYSNIHSQFAEITQPPAEQIGLIITSLLTVDDFSKKELKEEQNVN